MCIYCTTSNYRKIYENHHGPIPKDDQGRTYEIHHIDGDHCNNDPSNLQCVSIDEHFEIHKEQENWGACRAIANRREHSQEELSILAKLAVRQQISNGKNRFTDAQWNRQNQLRRIKDKTHNFLVDNPARKNNYARLKRGVHPTQLIVTCPHCGLSGGKTGMMTSHFDRCKHAPGYQYTHIPDTLVICPHCNRSGGSRNMRRYHFDRCKRRCH